MGKCVPVHQDRLPHDGDCGGRYGISDIIRRIPFYIGRCTNDCFGKHPATENIAAKAEFHRKIGLLSLLQTVLQYLFFYIGLAHTTGVKASIIEAVSTFVAILVAGYLFHQETVTSRKMLGCLIGFAGVVLVNVAGSGMDFHFSPAGDGCILLSTVAYAFSSVCMKRFSQKEDPVMLSGYQFIFGGIVMIACGAAMGGHLKAFTASAAALLIYMAMISAVAYSLWGMLLKYNPVSKVTVFGFMNPVIGVILSALLLNETESLGVSSVLALGLVCVGIYIVNAKAKE